MPPLIQRQIATQATKDRYFGKPFAWGEADCARMAAFHLKAMGWPVKLAGVGAYKTALGAKRALARLGHASLTEAMDARFARISPAATLIGDILSLAGDDAFGALVIAVGNGRVLGWHEDAAGAVILQPLTFDAAWTTL